MQQIIRLVCLAVLVVVGFARAARAQKPRPNPQLSYLNLVGSYLTATAQLSLAIGREVLQ